jgi:hypothetical protein
MIQTIRNGTPEGFYAFCDWLTDKGLMQRGSIEPIRSATKQVLTTVEPDNHDLDLRIVDIDDYMSRFVNLARHRYSPNSLRAYRSRFDRGIKMYRRYLEHGAASFKAPSGRTTRRSSTNSQRLPARESRVDDKESLTSQPTTQPSAALIDYPFPLASGTIAHLYLPQRLDHSDAERMSAYLRALVLEPQHRAKSAEQESRR